MAKLSDLVVGLDVFAGLRQELVDKFEADDRSGGRHQLDMESQRHLASSRRTVGDLRDFVLRKGLLHNEVRSELHDAGSVVVTSLK